MTTLRPDGSIFDPYQNFIAVSRYARYLDDLGRRETWTETVDRYMSFMTEHLSDNHCYEPAESLVAEISEAIKNLDFMPSMRAVMTAGEALELSNVAGYNCSYLPVDDLAAFSETLFILMNGTGVGYSVESRYVNQLPPVPEIYVDPTTIIFVGDSKLGWAQAYRTLIDHLWRYGIQPGWDLSAIRPAGARLKTFGGRASGPEPLQELFEYTSWLLRDNQGKQLTPIQVHDLMCKIASVVVVGGVRRSAMIALTDLADEEMAKAKTGEWWVNAPQRRLANISAVYEGKTTQEEFDREWDNLVESGSGERGIFNRKAARHQAAKNGRRSLNIDYGTNPCAEIILRPKSFCNLSEVVVRPEDTHATLAHKVVLATILGTWQATLTDFPFLRPEWTDNAQEERLLGVSLTGAYGNPLTYSEAKLVTLPLLNKAAEHANELEANAIGIPRSAAICTQKPSGTVSQLAGVSSGGHPWWAEYYIRTVRADKKDPLAQLMIDSGVPHESDIMDPDNTVIFSFPIRAPEGAVTRADLTAIEHLENWLTYKNLWCDHSASITVNVRPSEWEGVHDWVWEHLDELTGVSFLPYSEHTYKQAPYQEVSQNAWRMLALMFPDVRWADLPYYELSDSTSGSQVLACSADGCDTADLVAV